jgi:dihydrolipoamide dehydrogenase
MASEYDVIVIGGGPAGYPAAIRAAQNKLKVALIDEWKNKDGTAVFGGTCTNAGCIPSKALLESSELYVKTKEELGVHGIKVAGVEFDIAQMQKRKTGVVKASTGGIAMLLKSAGVTALQGHGKLLAGRKVEFTAHDGKKETLTGQAHRAGFGLHSHRTAEPKFDGKNIIDNWGALDLDAVPKKLGVVGAGIIGLELGSVWRRLGSEVVILEALDSFLAVADQGLAKEAARHFKKQGLDIKLGAKVSGAKATASGVEVTYTDASGSQTINVDKLIVCVGRRPYSRICSRTAPASPSMRAASSKSTTIARPRPKTSGPWAIACAVRCWRTRPRTRASWSAT